MTTAEIGAATAQGWAKEEAEKAARAEAELDAQVDRLIDLIDWIDS